MVTAAPQLMPSVVALSKTSFQEIHVVFMDCSKRRNLNSVLHLNFKGRNGKQNTLETCPFLKRKYTHCALQPNRLRLQLFNSFMGTQSGDSPIHISHHINFFKTRAYFVLTEH